MICFDCGHKIYESVEKCPFCGSSNIMSDEECLKNIDIPVKKMPTLVFGIIIFITFGLYLYFRIAAIIKDLNELYDSEQKSGKLSCCLIVTSLILVTVASVYLDKLFNNEIINIATNIIILLLYFIISNAMLNKIEQYAIEKYDIKIRYNRFLCLLFNFLYVNYAINSFSENIFNKKYNV